MALVEIGSLFSAFLESILGRTFDACDSRRQTRPRLCFKLIGTPECELIEKSLRTKTSPSEFSIEIYSIGQVPVIMESFSLTHRCGLLIDCFLTDQDKTIQPYAHITYTLMEQEADALEWHCRKVKFQKCNVTANDIEGRHIKAVLDVSWIAARAHFIQEENIGIDK